MTSSTGSTLAASISWTWFKILKPISTMVFYWPSMSSKVAMGVVYTSEACGVFDIKVTSWTMPIWCGVKGTLVDKNSKYSNLLSNITYEWLTGSSYFLSDLSLPSTSWLTIVVTKIGIIKVWTCKGMISKLVPPLKGLIGLVTSCTIDGVAEILLLVSISTYTKLGGSYLKLGKAIW